MGQVYWHNSSKGPASCMHFCEMQSVLVIFLVSVTKYLTEKALGRRHLRRNRPSWWEGMVVGVTQSTLAEVSHQEAKSSGWNQR